MKAPAKTVEQLFAEIQTQLELVRKLQDAQRSKAENGSKRASSARERLQRIHKLANWAIQHGAEKELFDS